MDSQQLYTFVRVAERLNFSRAAKELSYAQSSVTSQIKRLEQETGTPLFDRLPGGVRLTAAGEHMLPYARQILQLMGEAKKVGGAPDELSGALVVGTMESIASYRLLPIVEYMHLRFPNLLLSMRSSPCEQTVESILRGAYDCGFFMDTDSDYPGVEAQVLCEEELCLISSPDHPLVGQESITVADLRRGRILGTEPGCAYRDQFQSYLSTANTEPISILEFGTIDSIKRGVASGLGVALLPLVACDTALDDGSIVRLNWTAPFTVHTYIAWRSGHAVRPAVRALAETSKQLVAEQRAE